MEDINYNCIGKRIKGCRKREKISQESLAEKIGVSPAHISHIETGNTIPSLKTFISLLNALNVSADEILLGHLKQSREALNREMAEIMSDCREDEIHIVTDIARACRNSLRNSKKLYSLES